ncbi:Uncharacterised protein [Vibrio cholerae]|nr:Uncharacterised protein [Vibrio cholerae]
MRWYVIKTPSHKSTIRFIRCELALCMQFMMLNAVITSSLNCERV